LLPKSEIIYCPVCGKGSITEEEYAEPRGIEGRLFRTKWCGTYSRNQSNGWIYKDYIGRKIFKEHGVVESSKIGCYVGHDDDQYGVILTLKLETSGVGWQFWKWEDIIEFAMRAKKKDLADLKGIPILAYFLDDGDHVTWGKSIIGLEVNENLVL
jgi:hypothetical protein